MNDRIKPFFECDYCGKKLTTEARLAKHNCKQKQRHLFLKTQKGKAAYFAYGSWMAAMGRKTPPLSTFAESKYFDTFKEFITYSNSVGLPDRKAFIGYMVSKSIDPTVWMTPDMYDDFIHYFDESKTPMELCEISLSTLLDLSEIFECDLGEVFTHMYTSDIMKLVISRKLSPWLLLFSEGFMDHMKFDTTSEQKILINAVIDYKVWREKFKENPEAVEEIKAIIHEFKI